MSRTSVVEKWVDEAAALTKPSKVIWADGSKQEYDRLVEDMLHDSTLLELNQQTYPPGPPITGWSPRRPRQRPGLTSRTA